MEQDQNEGNSRQVIKEKLRQNFDGKIVRKDLTKKIKEGANVPTYVLEFLLGQYCSSDDEEIVSQGVDNVKRILAENYVRPDENEKVLSRLRQRGSMTIIDQVTVSLNLKYDYYEAAFSNLGLSKVPIADEYPEKYDRLLAGGIWCIIQLEYNNDNNPDPDMDSKKPRKQDEALIGIRKLTPIQMPHVEMEDFRQGRKQFTKEEWMDVLLRSTGMEPDELTYREKWLLLTRMLPFVENNFNLCELGPRSTGKSHLYKEISPNSILVSGGQTTVANLFYNMGRKTMGLVGLWDVVAFDEVAGIKFKDNDGIQIMKDYMASGSFARGKEEKAASASMVFVGNINQSVDVLLKTSSLFDPFPPEMGTDTAFLDRIHCYNPGWEIPKFRPEHFTNDYGFISDYLSEVWRELRKEQYGDSIEKYFRLGRNLNQRDTIAVRKMVDGYIKLLYPDGEFTKEDLEEVLTVALEMRRRVKEQLKKLGGMEFYDVNFSYIDLEDMSEHYVSVPEQGGGKLIPEGMCNPGQVYTVSRGKSGMIGVFRLESQMLPGNGKFDRTGLGSDRQCKEATDTAYNFLKANGKRISGSISTTTKDYIVNYQDLQGLGMSHTLALPTLIALCSIALQKPVQSSMAVLGDISISGTMMKVDELASTLQVCLDSGAKKVLLPQTSAVDLGTVPADLMSSFSLVFYQSAEDAVFKALGVE
jgi:ATP-dependent Lon protease